MTGYDTAGWGDLLACAGAAAAALAGLIFVGLSVNMSTLLDLDRKRGQNFLTGRALEALVAMLNILVICIVTLTPHLLRGVLAAFILLTAVASAIAVTARGSRPSVHVSILAPRVARGRPRQPRHSGTASTTPSPAPTASGRVASGAKIGVRIGRRGRFRPMLFS